MPPLSEPIDLLCPNCDNGLFVPVVAIRSNQGGGTVFPPRGYQCLMCHQHVDLASVLAKAEIARAEREIEQKQRRYDELKQRTMPQSGPSRSSSTR